jgi:hypothetical protein
VHLAVSGAPLDQTVIYFMGTVESPGGRDGIATQPRVAPDGQSAELALVGGLGASVVGTAIQHLFGSDRSSRNVVVRRAAQPSGDLSLAVATDFLPEIVSSEVTIEAGQARPTMRMGTAGDASLAGADGQLFTMYWLTMPTLDSRHWTAIVPPGTTSVTMPELPESLALYYPQPTDELHRPVAAAFEADSVDGYDQFRPLIGELPTPNSELPLARQVLPPGPFLFKMTVSTASPV